MDNTCSDRIVVPNSVRRINAVYARGVGKAPARDAEEPQNVRVYWSVVCLMDIACRRVVTLKTVISMSVGAIRLPVFHNACPEYSSKTF